MLASCYFFFSSSALVGDKLVWLNNRSQFDSKKCSNLFWLLDRVDALRIELNLACDFQSDHSQVRQKTKRKRPKQKEMKESKQKDRKGKECKAKQKESKAKGKGRKAKQIKGWKGKESKPTERKGK